jgi:hypothetical protein
MAVLLSTFELLRLRQRLAVDTPARDEVEATLRARRSEMTVELSKVDCSIDRVYDIFSQVWANLAAAPEDHAWHVPSLHVGEALQLLLHHVVAMLLARELRRICGSTESAGHAVLGAVGGTGKTTLLRAVTIAVAVLFDRMLPVIHTYAAAADAAMLLPSSLVRQARATLGQPTDGVAGVCDDAAQWELGLLRAGGHEVLLALDGFQHVFALPPPAAGSPPGPPPSSLAGLPAGLPAGSPAGAAPPAEAALLLRRRISVAAEVETVCRFEGSFGLLAGSCADMRALLFRRGSRENPDPWRARGFPDFNGSVYQLFTVPALRTHATLRAFLSARYPGWRLTDLDVAELLHYTGGIPQLAQSAWEQMGAPAAASSAHGIERALPWLRGSVEASGTHLRRFSPSEAFCSLPLARAALTAIAFHHREAVEADAAAERRRLPCVGVSALILEGLMRSIATDDRSVGDRTAGDVGIADRRYGDRGSGGRLGGDRGIDAAAAVRHLVDLGLLCEHQGVLSRDSQIQPARPCDAHVYTGSTAPDLRQLFLLTAVRLTLEGCVDECPPARSASPRARCTVGEGASASEDASGSVLKELVLPGVARLLLPPAIGHAGPLQHPAVPRICIQHGLLCLWQPSDVTAVPAGTAAGAGVGTTSGGPGAWVPFTPAAAAAVTGVLLSCSGEAGLDGVLLCPDTDDGEPHPALCAAAPRTPRWRLNGWRCTGAPRTAQLTGGDMGAAVDRFVRAGTAGGLDSSTWAGTLVSAQAGVLHAWHEAMEASGAAAPLPQLIPASLTLTTTADATLARAALDRMGAHMILDSRVAAAVGWPVQRTAWQREWVRAARTARITVKLFGGSSWIRECLSEVAVRDADWLESTEPTAGAGRRDAGPALAARKHACAIM